jgi:hypothetical protein
MLLAGRDGSAVGAGPGIDIVLKRFSFPRLKRPSSVIQWNGLIAKLTEFLTPRKRKVTSRGDARERFREPLHLGIAARMLVGFPVCALNPEGPVAGAWLRIVRAQASKGGSPSCP